MIFTRLETGGRKKFYEYIFLKKSLKDYSSGIIRERSNTSSSDNIAAMKHAKQILKNPYSLVFYWNFLTLLRLRRRYNFLHTSIFVFNKVLRTHSFFLSFILWPIFRVAARQLYKAKKHPYKDQILVKLFWNINCYISCFTSAAALKICKNAQNKWNWINWITRLFDFISWKYDVITNFLVFHNSG